MNIFKRLFCKHAYKYSHSIIKTYKEIDFGGDGYNTWQESYNEYVCTKCGKRKRVLN